MIILLLLISDLTGQGVLDEYIDLILRCGMADQKAILTVCHWKNRRTLFWIEKKPGKRKERERKRKS